MNEKELLMELLDEVKSIKTDVTEINTKLNKMQEDIEILKEDSEITRTATNQLVQWAEKASVEVKIPLFEKA